MKESLTETRDKSMDYILPRVTPDVRMRRLRSKAPLRAMIRETHLRLEQLIYPFFIVEGKGIKTPIKSMPGIHQQSIDEMLKEAAEVVALGIKSVLLFGIPATKDADATGAWHSQGIVQKATRELKKHFPDLIVVADTCLCEYMDHGHCGIVHEGKILNDPSLEILARAAVSQAEAGADIIAPSDMMDGRIAAIRAALDANGYENIPIMAYSAKFASALYGPFREAAESAPQFGDRTSYQMDPANAREAMREIELDIEEGADIVMVKPAMPYLDLISEARYITKLPVAAYNVSGEYSMVKAAAANGWIDEKRVVMELLTGIVRAGADLIITYHAKDVAEWLK
ncbi:MAG TPA: porphobilinogen synthase [Candidatus Obscuribacter sp.]|nr:porphobilinogen synthase [Candidatus Obscuribacter sp.]HMX47233.1 porphobilinogen synthase [Candidatus Obscuribacter sp.]HMY53293.1 porphobilinogen synthase [Candidatus Obscuribacter sp.]HNA72026.1 porphobilinogen synthase [Candidatus Obscuribacter sp.]HNB14608.1 porphobilinogen synthase [Candidatus Obscuribacter sp.]